MTNTTHRPEAPQSAAQSARDAGGNCYEEYISLLGSQRSLVGELDALSQRQSTLIEGPDMEPLLALLDERQRVIDQVMPLTRTLDELRWRWKTVRGSLPETNRDQVQRAEDSVLQLFTQVTRRDERDQARLKKRLEEAGAELAALATSRRATNAYGSPSGQGARFQDHQA